MTKSKNMAAVALAASALGLGAGMVRAAEPTTEELMKQIDALQSKVQQLETRQQALNSKDVDATVAAVLRDADKRSELLQMEGFTAGWTKDKGFRIQSADGNWVLHPSLQFQFRSVTNFRHDGKHVDPLTGEGDDDMENGFEIRRMKFGFDGNAFTPDLTYYFLWNTDKDGGDVFLEQAWVRYFFNDAWAFRVGQIVNPVFHEQTTSSKYQLAADRSLVNFLITGTNEAFSQVVSMIMDQKDSPFQIEFGVEDGYISGNTDFVDKAEGADDNWGAFARVNYFMGGTRGQYKDFTAMGNQSGLTVLGAGVDITESGDSVAYRWCVDGQWENAGSIGVYAAALGNYIDDGTDEFCNYGFLIQAGFMVTPTWEIFGRYDYTRLDDALPIALEHDEYCEVTLGVNWYVGHSHDAKVTIDLTWLPNGAPSDISSLDYLATSDDEVVVRGQFQLLL